MILRNLVLLVISGTVLSGCIDDEKSCYDKLRTDFTASQAFASEQLRGTPEYMKDERQSYIDYATTASRSKSRLSAIFLDDDQSVCDYISDGPRLRQK